MGAVSFFLVFLAIVLIGATVWAGAGGPSGIFRRGRTGAGLLDDELLSGGFEQPVANLPPVLLPAEAAPADVDRLRFSLGLRGYRMDQVDQVLDELRDQLAAKNQEVERLRQLVLEAGRSRPAAEIAAPVIAEDGTPEERTAGEGPAQEPAAVPGAKPEPEGGI
jgi:DivIVA domain-containing protein